LLDVYRCRLVVDVVHPAQALGQNWAIRLDRRAVAALEAVAERRLFDRSRTGVTLTAAGSRLLATAIRVLDELDLARREVAGDPAPAGPVRLGAFASAAAGLIPKALASLPPELKVTLREGTTPALTRALRAGTLDLAILAQTPPFRPPDDESPALEITTISERELVIGVGARHPLAGARAVELDQLKGCAVLRRDLADFRSRSLRLLQITHRTHNIGSTRYQSTRRFYPETGRDARHQNPFAL